jgi:hypothetical protein
MGSSGRATWSLSTTTARKTPGWPSSLTPLPWTCLVHMYKVQVVDWKKLPLSTEIHPTFLYFFFLFSSAHFWGLSPHKKTSLKICFEKESFSSLTLEDYETSKLAKYYI